MPPSPLLPTFYQSRRMELCQRVANGALTRVQGCVDVTDAYFAVFLEEPDDPISRLVREGAKEVNIPFVNRGRAVQGEFSTSGSGG